jgi:hypothetical protein
MSGYLLVVDSTRRTLVARQLQQKASSTVSGIPLILLLSKVDLASRGDRRNFFLLVEQGWRVIRTARKPAEGVGRPSSS